MAWLTRRSQVILYLSYFYKHVEMSFRLGLFYMAMTIADVLVALLAFGLLRMRGVHGLSGWRWMFLIEVCCPGINLPLRS